FSAAVLPLRLRSWGRCNSSAEKRDAFFRRSESRRIWRVSILRFGEREKEFVLSPPERLVQSASRDEPSPPLHFPERVYGLSDSGRAFRVCFAGGQCFAGCRRFGGGRPIGGRAFYAAAGAFDSVCGGLRVAVGNFERG